MKVEKLYLKNYKGFKETEVEFHPTLNVFIGDNGAGKTSILNAILKSLYSFTSSVALSDKKYEMFFKLDEINYSATYFYVEATINLGDFSAGGMLSLFNCKGSLPEELQEQKQSIQQELQTKKNYLIKTVREKPINIPIIKFLPANRGNYNKQFGNQKVYAISQLEAWGNIYQDNITFSKFFEWFFEHENHELRLKRDSQQAYEHPQLKFVRTCITKAFKILQNKDFILKSNEVKREGNNKLIPTITLENKENPSEKEDFEHKSDGEKAMIALIADIAYNLAISSVEKEKSDNQKEEIANDKGIVLIDEIEAHLHPKWQREIIPLLGELFPNLQFFITTHSPQVISAAKSESIFLCENFKISPIHLKTKGTDTNSLLKFIFNATERPKKLADLLKQFDKGINESGEIEALKTIIEEIKKIENEDAGNAIRLLSSELELQLEAYKFDLEHEMD